MDLNVQCGADANRSQTTKEALYDNVLLPVNEARACIAEVKRVTNPNTRKQLPGGFFEINPEIFENLISHSHRILYGFQKYMDLGILDRQVFSNLARELQQSILFLQTYIDKSNAQVVFVFDRPFFAHIFTQYEPKLEKIRACTLKYVQKVR